MSIVLMSIVLMSIVLMAIVLTMGPSRLIQLPVGHS